MPVSRSLIRLLRIRNLQERQSRVELESALAEVHRLEQALAAAKQRGQRGQRLVIASTHSAEVVDRMVDRIAGLTESHAAERHANALGPRIADAEQNAEELRQHFLERRVERRQAETLIAEQKASDAIDAQRRGQQTLDDWHGARKHRGEYTANHSASRASANSNPA